LQSRRNGWCLAMVVLNLMGTLARTCCNVPPRPPGGMLAGAGGPRYALWPDE